MLNRDVGLVTRHDERRRAHGVGRVTELDVRLEHRATVDRDLVLRLVLLGVVRVGGVGHVAGRDDSPGEGTMEVLPPASGRGHDAFEHRGQQGRHSAALGPVSYTHLTLPTIYSV